MRRCPTCQREFADAILYCSFDGSPTTLRPSSEDPLIGRVVGSYRLKSKLGAGGMGAVYMAEHPSIGSRVAVKVLHPQYAQNATLAGRFLTEAKASNIIRHENIVQVVDYLSLDGTTPCLVMEYLDQGYLLTELADRPRPLTVTGPILLQVCDALAAAHERGIVHRDLKPENIYLAVRNGHKHVVKLMDFGIAKLISSAASDTHVGTVMGTPRYMSPEQALGNVDAIGPASDLYSLGVIMYHLATGVSPFDGDFATLVASHISREPLAPRKRNPEIPPAYEVIVQRCLEKKPANRFASARDLKAALEHTLQALSISRELPLADDTSIPIGRDNAETKVLGRASSRVASAPGGRQPTSGSGLSPFRPGTGTAEGEVSKSTTQLTTKLRGDHLKIVELLGALKERSGADDEARRLLGELERTLSAHMNEEEERLFPALRKAAEHDPKLRSVLAVLAGDLAEVSEFVSAFFERCRQLEPGASEDFASEIGTFETILMARLWKEEHSFFAEYEKLRGRADSVELLAQLQVAHAALAELFERARACSDPKEVRAILFSAREPLVQHLEYEDREFYPSLRKQAESDARLRSTLGILARDMDEISAYALGFFERCAGDDLSDAELAAECERLATVLAARLWKEENILFPEFKKLAKAGNKRTLIDELKEDHRLLLGSLEKLRDVNILSSEGRQAATAVRRSIVEHLQKEKKSLVPMLRRVAEKEEALRQALDLFELELGDLADEVLASFERATADGAREVDFARAHGSLVTLMKLSVRREEAVLFPRVVTATT